MITQNKKEFDLIKKKNNFTLSYLIEKKVNIKKIELLIDNVLKKKKLFYI